MKQKLIMTILVAVLMLAGGLMAKNPAVRAQDNQAPEQYASVNGLALYYEIHGAGEPLIMLHGGFGGVPEFGQLVPLLAETRQVIAVEMQGHGHTADIDRPLSYEALADDVAALIAELGYENADVLGFSLGGGVALQTAIRHPEVVRKLVIISASFRREAIHPEFRMGMEMMSAETAGQLVGSPMEKFYTSVAPNPADFPALVGKLGQMLSQDYDWSEAVAEMTTPTLIIAGDSDMLPASHAVELFELLGGGVAGDYAGMPTSQLAVLPGTSHFTMLMRTDLLLSVITPFLDAPLPEAQ